MYIHVFINLPKHELDVHSKYINFPPQNLAPLTVTLTIDGSKPFRNPTESDQKSDGWFIYKDVCMIYIYIYIWISPFLWISFFGIFMSGFLWRMIRITTMKHTTGHFKHIMLDLLWYKKPCIPKSTVNYHQWWVL